MPYTLNKVLKSSPKYIEEASPNFDIDTAQEASEEKEPVSTIEQPIQDTLSKDILVSEILTNSNKTVKRFISLHFILSFLIYFSSLLIGVSIGSISLPKHTSTLNNEYTIVDNEIKTMKLQEEFYKQQTNVLKQTKKSLNQVYIDLKSISLKGILGEIRSYPDGIQAVYYLTDITQIDSLVTSIKANYSVISVSQTDSIKIDDNVLTVYTITLK